MRRTLFAPAISFSMVLLLTGCFPSVDTRQPSQSGQAELSTPSSKVSEQKPVPSHVSKALSEDISVDAEVQYTDGKYSVYQGTYRQFTENSLTSIFLKDESIQARQTLDGSLFGEDVSITTEKQNSLYIASDYFDFQRLAYNDYTTFITGESDYFLDNLSEAYPAKSLSSLNKEEAIQKVARIVRTLSLPVNEKSLQIYSLTAKALNRQATQFMTNEEYQNDLKARGKTLKHKFTSEDEAYLLVYHCQIDGLPLHFEDYAPPSKDGVAVKGARVHALVNKNGLIMFQAHGIPQVNPSLRKSTAIVPLDTALNAVKNKYRNTILTGKLKITNISLSYFPSNIDQKTQSFLLTPAWEFSTEMKVKISDAKGKQEALKKGRILINAVTGEEIR